MNTTLKKYIFNQFISYLGIYIMYTLKNNIPIRAIVTISRSDVQIKVIVTYYSM